MKAKVNQLITNLKEGLNPKPPILRRVDYDKVTTTEDVKAILKAIYPNINVSTNITSLDHLLKDE